MLSPIEACGSGWPLDINPGRVAVRNMRQGLAVLSLILLMAGSSGLRAGAAAAVPSPTPPGVPER